MTFEEYWYSCCDFHKCDECDIKLSCSLDKVIAQSAWEASQPKWTLCKDGMPDTKGNFLCIWNNGFYNVQQVCMYEKKIKMFITNTLFPVIAWMPLPEVPEGI